MSRLVILTKGGGQTLPVPVLTSLADTGPKGSRAVFNKDRDTHCLSRVHVPGKDGFAEAGAPDAVLCRNLVPVQRICRQPS